MWALAAGGLGHVAVVARGVWMRVRLGFFAQMCVKSSGTREVGALLPTERPSLATIALGRAVPSRRGCFDRPRAVSPVPTHHSQAPACAERSGLTHAHDFRADA